MHTKTGRKHFVIEESNEYGQTKNNLNDSYTGFLDIYSNYELRTIQNEPLSYK